jgi:hypothetical protein
MSFDGKKAEGPGMRCGDRAQSRSVFVTGYSSSNISPRSGRPEELEEFDRSIWGYMKKKDERR